MNTRIKIFTLFLICANLLLGQFSDPVTVSASVNDTIRAGEIVNVDLAFTIDRGWHIYGTEEIESGPIPTTIEITGDAINQVGKANEPAPEISYDEGFEMDIPHHSGYVVITVPVKINDNVQSGIVPITVKAIYQSCDNTICYPPFDQTAEVDVFIEEGAPRVGKTEFVE